MTDETLDAEIRAMTGLSAALGGLDPDAVRRVLRWAVDRYQVKGAAVAGGAALPPAAGDGGDAPAAPPVYADFAELYDAANPNSGVENALVAGYWFQALMKNAELDSQQLNAALKNLGRPSTNITRDLDSLMTRSPRLVIQVRKDGSTKQARKRYKLTTEGVKAVERMLTRSGRPVVESAAAEAAPEDGGA